MEKLTEPKLIGICGGSCSGKTTLTHSLSKHFGPEKSLVLFQDNYYIDQSRHFDGDGGSVNFDHPNALELDLLGKHLFELKSGRSIHCPRYDFVTHKRLAQSDLLFPKQYILVDGTLILHHPLVRQNLDLSIFLSADEDLRYGRRLKRDVEQRGRSAEGVFLQFSRQVKPMHDQFVETSSVHAKVIISGKDVLESLPKILGQIATLK